MRHTKTIEKSICEKEQTPGPSGEGAVSFLRLHSPDFAHMQPNLVKHILSAQCQLCLNHYLDFESSENN